MVCGLTYQDSSECETTFVFREKGLDGAYDELAYANVKFVSECTRLAKVTKTLQS